MRQGRKIRHVVSGLSRAMHDKNVLEMSQEFNVFLNSLPPDYIVVGDAAYQGIGRNLVVTFIGRLDTRSSRIQRRACAGASNRWEVDGASQIKWRFEQVKENHIVEKNIGCWICFKCVVSVAVFHNRFTKYLNKNVRFMCETDCKRVRIDGANWVSFNSGLILNSKVTRNNSQIIPRASLRIIHLEGKRFDAENSNLHVRLIEARWSGRVKINCTSLSGQKLHDSGFFGATIILLRKKPDLNQFKTGIKLV